MSVLRKVGKAVRLLRYPVFRRGLRHGVGAAIEHRHLAGRLRPRTVLDIGANKGQFSLLARQLFPDAVVHAFEPLPGPAAVFRRVLDDPQVVLHELAIAPAGGDAVINVSRREDSSSLLPITALQARTFPGTERKETLTVRTARLGDVLDIAGLERPILAKIDVQGYELDVLRGFGDALRRVDDLYVECSFVELYAGQALAWEVVEFLQSRGLVVRGIYNLHYGAGGLPVQGDFHFSGRPDDATRRAAAD